jgi:hypothetical protein
LRTIKNAIIPEKATSFFVEWWFWEVTIFFWDLKKKLHIYNKLPVIFGKYLFIFQFLFIIHAMINSTVFLKYVERKTQKFAYLQLVIKINAI